MTRKAKKRGGRSSKRKCGARSPAHRAAVDYAQKLCRLRAEYKCFVCGSTTRQTHAHHLIGRSVVAYSADQRNLVCLCSRCHNGDSKLSAHLAPWAFEAWMKEHARDRWVWWDNRRWRPESAKGRDWCEIRDRLKATYERELNERGDPAGQEQL